MGIKNILLLILFLFGFMLAILAYSRRRRHATNISFSLFALFASLWPLTIAMFRLSTDIKSALFWDRMIYLCPILVASSFLAFVHIFPKKEAKLTFFNKLTYLTPIILLTPLLLFTRLWIQDIELNQMGNRAILGTAYFLWAVWFSVYMGWAFIVLFRKYRKSRNIERTQLRYIIIAVIFPMIGALPFNIILPAFGSYQGNYRFIWLGPFSLIAMLAVIAYAIIKYRLMDIRLAIKRSTIFSGVVIMITAAYALAAFLLSWMVFGGVYTFRTQIIVGLIIAFLVALGFRPLYDWLKRITDTFLFKGEYKPQELMADISDVLSRTLDLDKVISILREQIRRALRVGKMEVVVLEEDGSQISKAALGKLIAYFKKQREVLVLEELKRKQAEKVGFDKSFLLIRDLEKLKAALAVPLLVKEKLVGIFLLSAKKSGDMFTNEDIKTLEAIAAQAAIAVENARLYEKMKDFSKTLQKEVNRQTKSLRKANIRLEQLDKAKSEFISLASHQLRTPLSIVKGYISMLLEGTWGTTNEKQKEHLEKVYTSNERLIKLVEDLLIVSRIESGRLEFNFQPLALDNLTESMVKEFSQLAASKGLYLKYLKSEKSLPLVKADSLKIRQVIQNLIDNAIHYTKKGGATIRLKAEKNKVRFSIEDTGIGISSEEQVTLFEKFSRGKAVTKIHTEGTGLGLYLAAKLIEAHQGKIWMESEGKGKGSAFYFELPMKRKK